MTGAAGRFNDLRTRIVSALFMVALGAGALWLGGPVFLVLVGLVAGLMIWELGRMLGPDLAPAKAALLALIGGVAVLRVGYDSAPLALTSLLLAPVLGLVLLKRDRGLFLVYGAGVLFAAAALFWLRERAGLGWALWLVAVVVAADVGGYFFGRILGGPKILPRISPKKTWSGTLGGWLLAALVGAGFAAAGQAGWLVITLSLFTAIASQAGDVAESAIKRHAGVKDSSGLIPGHGGVLDRFDALIAAALFVLVITRVFPLPAGGAG